MLPVLTAHAQPNISGGATLTHQSTDDPRIRSEWSASADLVLTWTRAQGEWRIYFEGNSSPHANGVSTHLPEANADAGRALDNDRKGRVQISELAYAHQLSSAQTLTLGLLDITGYFDQSRIASDENTQFLGVSFVQNPMIEFPDYALGVVYEHTLDNTATTTIEGAFTMIVIEGSFVLAFTETG